MNELLLSARQTLEQEFKGEAHIENADLEVAQLFSGETDGVHAHLRA